MANASQLQIARRTLADEIDTLRDLIDAAVEQAAVRPEQTKEITEGIRLSGAYLAMTLDQAWDVTDGTKQH